MDSFGDTEHLVMNNAEAQAILDERLTAFARRPYSELAALVGRAEADTVRGDSGVDYQLEFTVFYDDAATRSDLRIVGSIDDGGWRAYVPLTKTLRVRSSGELF